MGVKFENNKYYIDEDYVNYNSGQEIPSGSGAEYINIMIKPEFIDFSLKGSENAFSILALSDFKAFSDTVHRGHQIINFSGTFPRLRNYRPLAIKRRMD